MEINSDWHVLCIGKGSRGKLTYTKQNEKINLTYYHGFIASQWSCIRPG